MTWWSRLTGRAGRGASGARQPDVAEVSLADVRDLPRVAAAIAAAPSEWRGTTWAYGDEDEPVDASASLEELLDWIWVEADDGVWSLSLGEELSAVAWSEGVAGPRDGRPGRLRHEQEDRRDRGARGDSTPAHPSTVSKSGSLTNGRHTTDGSCYARAM